MSFEGTTVVSETSFTGVGSKAGFIESFHHLLGDIRRDLPQDVAINERLQLVLLLVSDELQHWKYRIKLPKEWELGFSGYLRRVLGVDKGSFFSLNRSEVADDRNFRYEGGLVDEMIIRASGGARTVCLVHGKCDKVHDLFKLYMKMVRLLQTVVVKHKQKRALGSAIFHELKIVLHLYVSMLSSGADRKLVRNFLMIEFHTNSEGSERKLTRLDLLKLEVFEQAFRSNQFHSLNLNKLAFGVFFNKSVLVLAVKNNQVKEWRLKPVYQFNFDSLGDMRQITDVLNRLLVFVQFALIELKYWNQY